MKNVDKSSADSPFNHDKDFGYTQISVRHDPGQKVAWCYMHGVPRSCFTPTMLSELQEYFHYLSVQNEQDIRYMVHASSVPGTYSYGGDLNLFMALIRSQDRPGLLQYAKACIDALYAKIVHFNRTITVISLVQGDALGGGFECALACDVLIAERTAKLGLPEILFNLFPGMGAYSLLSRKVGGAKADKMILGGNLYSAENLYEMGIVDILVEPGKGESAVYEYIKKEEKFRNGYLSYRDVTSLVNPVPYAELLGITEIWVDAALRLDSRDIRMMERLVSRQTEKNSLKPQSSRDESLTNAHGSVQG
jgi:DSF synthase